MTNRPNRRVALSCALILVPLAVGLTACGEDASPFAAAPYDASDQIAVNIGEDGGTVDHRKPLEVTTTGSESRITDVIASDGSGRRVRGELSADGSRWHSTAPLTAGVRYTVLISTEKAGGAPGSRTVRFETKPANGRKLDVTLGPDKGVYGVGQPLVAELSHRIKDPGQRRTVEHALLVDSSPGVEGAWHWADSKTLHYRPKEYWPENATITARAALKGVSIRDGLSGGNSARLSIRTGDRVEALVDIGAHRMTVRKNGKKLRTVPVTTGKPGFQTRNGVKVVLGKQQFIRMRGTSIGIPEGSSESYDLPVHWNTQVTGSGEFVHAAPWSAGSHGSANVSHGCTGMSTDNARWFFQLVRKGDIVKYVNGGGERMPVFGNGFGDWNMSWQKWREGSALRGGTQERGTGGDAARLRFEV
ncbi:Ig-like domain-containing protein [Streptomyces sp. N2-109]|uniref:Ig-like domain-containing protein n=1 Tax=Streptomyces gossypii TaxID=2883101 RepID=A0ABT2JZG6_9ACTN|nr:Ig-like domain-containing protein [Streptomyces gossypii]MCT2593301.1 Ig-like domain-containing protein [Streptomyces gossypii]